MPQLNIVKDTTWSGGFEINCAELLERRKIVDGKVSETSYCLYVPLGFSDDQYKDAVSTAIDQIGETGEKVSISVNGGACGEEISS